MITSRRALISLILASCAALMVWGFTLVRPTHTAVVYRNSAIVKVFPEDGTSTLRQSNVSVILASGYTLAYETTEGMKISVNHATVYAIPQDELQILTGQNQYSFTPGPGRQLSELPAGQICVVLQVTRDNNLTDPGTPFSWCFQTQ